MPDEKMLCGNGNVPSKQFGSIELGTQRKMHGEIMNSKFEQILISHCAPTLAGIKPANLFCYRYDSNEAINNIIEQWRNLLHDRGVEFFILRNRHQVCLVYVYRAKELYKILNAQKNQEFLSEQGYNDFEDHYEILARLAQNFESSIHFPHEVGLFLGYPLDDVIGFINNKGGNYHQVGSWKVYSDPESAVKKFEKFKKCTMIYKRLFSEGKTLKQLAVPV